MNESQSSTADKKSRYDKRSIFYIVVIVVGSLFLAMGLNLVLVSTGVIEANTYKTDATVVDCTDRQSCRVDYTRDGQTIAATFAQTAPAGLETGETVRITVFDGEPNRVYTEEVVPLGFALFVGTIGLMITTYAAVRLLQHWKRQRTTPRAE